MTVLSEENAIVAALRRIIRAVDRHSHQLLDEYGLTGPQLTVLQETAKHQGVSASDLARSVHLSRPTMAGILDRLTKRGLVERMPHPRDRRSQQILITEAGHAVLVEAPSLLQDRFRRELGRLEDWERTLILATLQRIASMMDAETLAAAPFLATGVMMTDSPAADAAKSPALNAQTDPDNESGSGC
jgi:DNA-binding MarR family transcriptional regulator